MRKLIPLAALGCVLGQPALAAEWTHKEIADALHSIMEADRTVYTKLIVNRLQNQLSLIHI